MILLNIGTNLDSTKGDRFYNLKETINLTTSWYQAYFKKKDMSELTKFQISYFLDK